MNSCTAYRTTVLSIGLVPDKYHREICVTSYATHCPIHGDLEVRATGNWTDIAPSNNQINWKLMEVK